LYTDEFLHWVLNDIHDNYAPQVTHSKLCHNSENQECQSALVPYITVGSKMTQCPVFLQKRYHTYLYPYPNPTIVTYKCLPRLLVQNRPSRTILSNSSPRSHRNATTPPINMGQGRIIRGKFILDTFLRKNVEILTLNKFLYTTTKKSPTWQPRSVVSTQAQTSWARAGLVVITENPIRRVTPSQCGCTI